MFARCEFFLKMHNGTEIKTQQEAKQNRAHAKKERHSKECMVGASVHYLSLLDCLSVSSRTFYVCLCVCLKYNVRLFIDKCVLYCAIVKFLDSYHHQHFSVFFCLVSFSYACFSAFFSRSLAFFFMFLFVAAIWIAIQRNRQFIRLLKVAVVVVIRSFVFAIVGSVIRLNVNFQSYIMVALLVRDLVCTVCCNWNLLLLLCFFSSSLNKNYRLLW